MVSLQKESEWEKKWNDGVRPCAWDEVADFVASAVSNREKEIAEEVKESFWECPVHGEPNPPTDCRDCNECLEVNVVLSNVLQIIKH